MGVFELEVTRSADKVARRKDVLLPGMGDLRRWSERCGGNALGLGLAVQPI